MFWLMLLLLVGLGCTEYHDTPHTYIPMTGEYGLINQQSQSHRLYKDSVTVNGDTIQVRTKHIEIIDGVEVLIPDVYNQTMYTYSGGFPAGWKWEIITDQLYNKGFPQIFIGQNPWRPGWRTTDKFPICISDIKNLIVSFDTEMDITIQQENNLTFDLWLVSDDTPCKDDLTNELMIWMMDKIPHQDNTGDGEVVLIGEEEWYFVSRPHAPPWKHNFNMFWSDREVYSGEIDLMSFINKLIELGIATEDEYVSNVQLGTELWRGVGEIQINKFDVQLDTRR